jgi:hypothetical protein
MGSRRKGVPESAGAICRSRCAIASACRCTPAAREQSGRSARVLRCGRAGVDRRAAPSWACVPQPAWTGWAVGGPGEVGQRRGTVRSVAQLSAAAHAATDRGTRLHGHAASGHGRSLGRGEHRGDQRLGPWIVVVVDVDRQRPNCRAPPRPASTVGNHVRDPRQAGAPLPPTARLMSRADTQQPQPPRLAPPAPLRSDSAAHSGQQRPDRGRRPQCSPANTGLDCG